MTLADYSISVLGGSASTGTFTAVLGWNSSNENVTFAISEALEIYGVTAEADATNTQKIHAILKYTLWQQVVSVLTDAIDYKTGDDTVSNNQMLKAAERRLDASRKDASGYATLRKLTVRVVQMDYPDDPYLYKPHG